MVKTFNQEIRACFTVKNMKMEHIALLIVNLDELKLTFIATLMLLEVK
jgi:hypothetical protein